MAFEEHEEATYDKFGNIDALKIEFITKIERSVGDHQKGDVPYFALPFLEELKMLIIDTKKELSGVGSSMALDSVQIKFDHRQRDIYGRLLQKYIEFNPTITELESEKVTNISFYRFCQKIDDVIEDHYQKLVESMIPAKTPKELNYAIDGVYHSYRRYVKHSRLTEEDIMGALSRFKLELNFLINNWNLCERLTELASRKKEEEILNQFRSSNEHFSQAKIRKLLEWIYFYNDKKEKMEQNCVTLANIASIIKSRSNDSVYDKSQTVNVESRIDRLLRNAKLLFDIDFVEKLLDIEFRNYDEDSRILDVCESQVVDLDNVFFTGKGEIVLTIGDNTYREEYHEPTLDSYCVPASLKESPKKKLSDWLDRANFYPCMKAKSRSYRIYINDEDTGELCIDDKSQLYFQSYRSLSYIEDFLIPNFFSDKEFIKILYANQLQRELKKIMDTNFLPADEKEHNKL